MATTRRTVTNSQRREARAARMLARAGVELGGPYVRQLSAEERRTRQLADRAAQRARGSGR